MRFAATAIFVSTFLPAIAGAQSKLFDGKTSDAVTPAKGSKVATSVPAIPAHPHARAAQMSNAVAFRLFAGELLGTNGLFSPLGYARADEVAGLLKKGPAKPSELRQLGVHLTAAVENDGPPRLELTTGLWANQRPIAQEVQDAWGVQMLPLETSSRARQVEEINTWFAQNTRDKVTKVVDSPTLAGAPAFVITDALNLRAGWLTPFDPAATKPAPFTTADGKAGEVPMMNLVSNLPYLKTADVELVVLPLSPEPIDDAAASLSVVLMLPAKGDVASLRSTLTADRFSGWLRQAIVTKAALEAWEKSKPDSDVESVLEQWLGTYPLKAVTVAVPKFKLQTPHKPLAGWSFGASSGPGLFAQACVIEVNESGINAEPSPRSEFAGTIGQPATFTANRPFLVAVVDQASGAVILAGQVDQP